MTADEKELLTDLAYWLTRRLKKISSRPGITSGTGGYAVLEIPDWEAKQKLDAIMSALGSTKADDERAKQLDQAVDLLKRVLRPQHTPKDDEIVQKAVDEATVFLRYLKN